MTHATTPSAPTGAHLKHGLCRLVSMLAGSLAFALLVPTLVHALPPGRHYEMVSQPYKGGYGVSGIAAVAPDGESVVYESRGAFAGTPADYVGVGAGDSYLARRGSSGWSTSSLTLPASLSPYGLEIVGSVVDFSSTLDQVLFFGSPGPNTGAAQSGSAVKLFLHRTSAPDAAPNAPEPGPNFELVSEISSLSAVGLITYGGASRDLSHVMVEAASGVAPLTPEAAGGVPMYSAPYDLMTHGGGARPLRFVGVNNQSEPKRLDPNCKQVELGGLFAYNPANGEGGKSSADNALALDGREIFFWTCAGAQGSAQLFVRLDRHRTLEVSRPLDTSKPFGGCVGEGNLIAGEVPCRGAATRPSAEFVGASKDGSKVFFTTNAQLIGEDGDTGTDLYMAQVGCVEVEHDCEVAKREVTSLTRVSRTLSPGEAARVQGVVAISQSGSRLYFVARGVLSGQSSEGVSPVAGADNLYVYDSESESTVFIAELCSESVRSGEREDLSCPGSKRSAEPRQGTSDEALWLSNVPQAQLAADGRFLVFSSFGRLTADDTDNARDVFRYDTQAGKLVRASVGEAGYDANGNGEYDAGFHASTISEDSHVVNEERLTEESPRVVSEDGSRIVFRTAEPLSPDATNGLVNTYEWHEGVVSLVSTGSDETAVADAIITSSGNDVYFATTERLLPQDTDEQFDLYDARIGEGFLATASGLQECAGDACLGPLMSAAPLLVPGSVSQMFGENLASPSAMKAVVKKTKVSRKKARSRKRRKGRRASHRGARRATGGRGR